MGHAFTTKEWWTTHNFVTFITAVNNTSSTPHASTIIRLYLLAGKSKTFMYKATLVDNWNSNKNIIWRLKLNETAAASISQNTEPEMINEF